MVLRDCPSWATSHDRCQPPSRIFCSCGLGNFDDAPQTLSPEVSTRQGVPGAAARGRYSSGQPRRKELLTGTRRRTEIELIFSNGRLSHACFSPCSHSAQSSHTWGFLRRAIVFSGVVQAVLKYCRTNGSNGIHERTIMTRPTLSCSKNTWSPERGRRNSSYRISDFSPSQFLDGKVISISSNGSESSACGTNELHRLDEPKDVAG